MNKKELIYIAFLTVLIAFMDISGIPSVFFVKVQIADIEPIYFALMVNFIIIGVIAFIYLKLLCPEWRLGFTKEGFKDGLNKYGAMGVIIAAIGLVAFFIGSLPFDCNPSALKVIIEGVVYYVGVAIIEELYVRGLLLNFIEKAFYKNKDNTLIAVVLSSAIFGLGHIFGSLNQPILVILSKVLWTTCMGIFFGMVYKKTGNLWLAVIFHFLVNVCALPYLFSSVSGYANVTLYIIVPVYVALGIHSIYELKKREKFTDGNKI